MASKYNTSEQEYRGIKIRLCTGFSYECRNAMQFRLMDTVQKIWIPKAFLYSDGTIRKGANIDFVFQGRTMAHKLKLARDEVQRNIKE